MPDRILRDREERRAQARGGAADMAAQQWQGARRSQASGQDRRASRDTAGVTLQAAAQPERGYRTRGQGARGPAAGALDSAREATQPRPATTGAQAGSAPRPIPLREGRVMQDGALEDAYNRQQRSSDTAMHTPTGVQGIYRRTGADGVPEFYNRRSDGTMPEPMTGGGVTAVPAASAASLAAGGGWRQRQGLRDAELAAIRRGDHPDQISAARRASQERARARSGMDTERMLTQANEAFERAARTSDARERSGLLRQARGLQQSAGVSAEMQGQQDLLSQRQRESEAAAERAMLQGRPDQSEQLLRLAQADHYQAQAEKLRAGERPEQPKLNPELMAQLNEQAQAGDPFSQQLLQYTMRQYQADTAANRIQQQAEESGVTFDQMLEALNEGLIDPDSAIGRDLRLLSSEETQNFAGGGLVKNPMDYQMGALSFAEGGVVPDMEEQLGPLGGSAMSMTGDPMASGSGGSLMNPAMAGPDPMQVEYQEYARGAEQLGIPAIPFEEFVQMRARTPSPDQSPAMMGGAGGASAMSFAEGGQVPDVSGQMVVDMDPAATTDSIPAMIDGQHPAALDSGEFVLPRFAVMYHGTDKLNKLIEQAKRGQTNGGESGSAAPA